MKLDTFFTDDVEIIGSGPVKSNKVRISAENTKYFISLLSKIYSDKHGSIVREITSNCFDAHRKANKIAPVIIRLFVDKETQQEFIEFVDSGTGLSPEAMDNVYMSLGESDKRQSDDFLGAFGLGSKSPFSHVSYFYVITTVNGFKYHYLLSESSDGISYDLLDVSPTDQENGTVVRIPFEDSNDRYSYSEAIARQLRYFDSVFVYGFRDPSTGSLFNNEYTISEQHKTFKYRKDFLENGSGELHVSLGPVTYPISFSTLGLQTIRIPVALKFEVGELEVTPSREQLQYGDKTIRALKTKIEEFTAEIRSILLTPENLRFNKLLDYIDFQLSLESGLFPIKESSLPMKYVDLNENGLLTVADCQPTLVVGDVALEKGIVPFAKIRGALLRGYKTQLWGSMNSSLLAKRNIGEAVNKLSSRKAHAIYGREARFGRVLLSKEETLAPFQRTFLNDNHYKLVARFSKHLAAKEFMRRGLRNLYKHIPLAHLRSFTAKLSDMFEEVVATTHVSIDSLNIPHNYGKESRTVTRTDGTILAYSIEHSPSRIEITAGHITRRIIYAEKSDSAALEAYRYAIYRLTGYSSGSLLGVLYVTVAKKYLDTLSKDPHAYSLDEARKLGLQAPWLINQEYFNEKIKPALVSVKLLEFVNSTSISLEKLSLVSDVLEDAHREELTTPEATEFFSFVSKAREIVDSFNSLLKSDLAAVVKKHFPEEFESLLKKTSISEEKALFKKASRVVEFVDAYFFICESLDWRFAHNAQKIQYFYDFLERESLNLKKFYKAI